MTDWDDFDLPLIADEGSTYDSWWFSWVAPGAAEITLHIDRIYEERGAIWSEMTVKFRAGEKEITVLTPSRVNLLNASRSGWKAHTDVFEGVMPNFPWDLCLQQAVEKTLIGYRAGNPGITYAESTDHEIIPHLLEPFVAGEGVTVLFGEGGMGKSTLAAAIAVSVATGYPIFGTFPIDQGPVIYFDYEDDDTILFTRIDAILAGIGYEGSTKPDIIHKKLVSKVLQSQSDMRREVAERKAKLAIIDSIGMARGGDAMGAEDTIRLFRSLRSFDVPVLALDHITKEDKRKREIVTPYGSIYTQYAARMLWGGREAEASTPTHKYINMRQTKSNHAQRDPDCGIEIVYINDTAKRLTELRFIMHDKWWQDHELPLWDKIIMLFDATPQGLLTTQEISDATERSRPQVSACLKLHAGDLFQRKRGRAYEYTLYRHARRLGLVTDDLGTVGE